MFQEKNRWRFVILITLLFVFSVEGQAARNQQQSGSITIHLEGESGEKLYLAKIANVEDGKYVTEERYRGVEIDLNTLKSAEELKQAAEIYRKYVSESLEFYTDHSGSAKLEKVELGVYLIYGEKISPFLLAVPLWSEELHQMLYDVAAYPKQAEQLRSPQTGEDSAVQQLMSVMVISVTAVFYLCRRSKYKQF